MNNTEITLAVKAAEEGGFVATWDDPRGGGIATQGDDLSELQEMVRDAVEGYFRAAGTKPPRNVRLHFRGRPGVVHRVKLPSDITGVQAVKAQASAWLYLR
jgi:predicted RNase H-like HicB family nuclease